MPSDGTQGARKEKRSLVPPTLCGKRHETGEFRPYEVLCVCVGGGAD